VQVSETTLQHITKVQNIVLLGGWRSETVNSDHSIVKGAFYYTMFWCLTSQRCYHLACTM